MAFYRVGASDQKAIPVMSKSVPSQYDMLAYPELVTTTYQFMTVGSATDGGLHLAPV